MPYDVKAKTSRAFLVGVELYNKPAILDVEQSLDELGLLADTAGLHVVGQATQKLNHPDPATFIRSGKVEEVKYWIEELDADIVIFDDELSPRHQRELEKAFGEDVQVIDRTALILDIFARHATTREGNLQVELAQYEYRLPRLTRAWTHLARQAGGQAGGGVGVRGPGETQLETDRREIGRRIAHLKQEIENVRAHRERYRQRRRRAAIPVVALVGYTNAGKSTLLNQLSGSEVYVADRLFATLDPTTRRVEMPSGREMLFTDTVGFIQKLPHTLVAAFRATLEEIHEASLILHIVDVAHPNAEEQIQVVENTLAEELDITDIPILIVFNKIDLLQQEDPERLTMLKQAYPSARFISALEDINTSDLLAEIESRIVSTQVRIAVQIPYEEGTLISRFYDVATVEHEEHTSEYVHLEGMVDPNYLGEFKKFRVAING